MNQDFGLPVKERWALATRRLGPVLVCPRLDSTNARLLTLAGWPDTDGLALLAEEQSAGRGQHGRTWQAGPRSSVLMSVLVYPPAVLCRPAVLTAWAAVSVSEVVRRYTGAAPTIKWPNDVLVNGRKVCGILIETAQQKLRLAAVVGIGLNVMQTEHEFRSAGLPEATSLANLGGRGLDMERVARALVEQLDADYDRLWAGDREGLESRWRQGIGLLDQPVVAECRGGDQAGRLIELSLDRIVLWREDGPPAVLAPESVLHLRKA